MNTACECFCTAATLIITLVQSGFLSAQSQVSVRDRENSSVAFTVIPAGNVANSKVVGRIKRLLPGGSSKEMADEQFKTNPKGARLMLNGWSAPKTKPLELTLPPGGYDVVIQADDAISYCFRHDPSGPLHRTGNAHSFLDTEEGDWHE